MAGKSGAILLTNDKDFGELIYRDRLFSKGVVLLRLGRLEIAEKIALLIAALDEHREMLEGAFVVIAPTGIRVRR